MFGLAFHVLHHAFSLRLLTRCQFVTAPLERIIAGLERQPHRCPLQVKNLAEAIDQKATVCFRQALRLIAMNNDNRRISATLMRVTKTNAPPTNQWRRMRLYRIFQFFCKFRG